MGRTNKGIMIAREILFITTFCLSIANIVLMIVQFALGVKEQRGVIRIKDNDELPF